MAQLTSMRKVTCINRSVNTSSTAGGQRNLMAEDEVEEGEEGDEHLLSVLLSMVSVTITPRTIVASIRSHQREAALVLSRQHRWKAAMTIQMQM